MTMRRIAALSGTVLAGFVLAGCAKATIEDAVPAGALTQSPVESPEMQTGRSQDTQSSRVVGTDAIAPAGTYPNLNVAPETAAPQISEQKKAADRTELRSRQAQIAAEGQRLGISQDAATLGTRARDRATEAQGNALSNDGEALRRLADRHVEEALKEIEGR